MRRFAGAALGLRRYALNGDALDPRPQLPKPVVNTLVTPVDLEDVADLGMPLRAERRDEHRHSCPDVRALEPLAVKTARTADDRPVGIAQRDPRAHRDPRPSTAGRGGETGGGS